MTITEFLLARITEDEAVANAATQGPWSVDDENYAEYITADGGWYVVSGGKWGGEASVFDSTEDAIHIALHDPARVLAECAAKRAIIEDYLHDYRMREDLDRRNTNPVLYYGRPSDKVLRQLAAVYKDHPDYWAEWAL